MAAGEAVRIADVIAPGLVQHDMVNHRAMLNRAAGNDRANRSMMRFDRTTFHDVADGSGMCNHRAVDDNVAHNGMMHFSMMHFRRMAVDDAADNGRMRVHPTRLDDMADGRVDDRAMHRRGVSNGVMDDGVMDLRCADGGGMRRSDAIDDVMDFDRMFDRRADMICGETTRCDLADSSGRMFCYRNVNNTGRLGMSDLREQHDGRNAADNAQHSIQVCHARSHAPFTFPTPVTQSNTKKPQSKQASAR